MNKKEIFKPYAIVALSALKELEKIEKKMEEKNKQEKKLLARQVAGMKHVIDRCFRLTGDFMPVHVSKLAKKYCDDNNLGDIFKIGWGKQATFEKKVNRAGCQLKHEHKKPVADLSKSLRKVKNLNEAIEIFEGQEIVWVTKDEDRKLPKTNRADSDKAYEDAEIVIIRNESAVGSLFTGVTSV